MLAASTELLSMLHSQARQLSSQQTQSSLLLASTQCKSWLRQTLRLQPRMTSEMSWTSRCTPWDYELSASVLPSGVDPLGYWYGVQGTSTWRLSISDISVSRSDSYYYVVHSNNACKKQIPLLV